MEQLEVMVIDDDIYVRQAMEALIRRHPQTRVFNILSNTDDAVSFLKESAIDPDVIVIDMHFQGSNKTGLDVIADINKESPTSKVLVCSMNRDQENVLKAINAGADGFIWKNESGEGIVSAIIQLAEGRFVVTKSIAELLMGEAVELGKYVEILQERKEYGQLTEELKKTLYLYCYCGMTAKEIAEELGLSIHTVNSRIKNIYQLINANNRAEAFSKFIERETKV